MKRLILVLSVLLLAMLVSPVLAVTDLTEVGFLPLNSFRNIIWNDTMFIEQGNTIRAYNVSPSLLADITAADVAGEVIFSYPVKGMYLDRNDSILYVSTVTSLSTVDVSDPLNPVLLGTALKWMGNGNMGQGIFAQDGFAYVGGTTQIFVFDVSNPSNPMYLTSKYYPYAETICVDVLVSDGTYLYGGYNPEGGTNTAWVSIWDISTPGTVTHYKTFQANPGGGGGYGDVTGLAYRNNTLYVTVYGSRMTTWDITNKSAPVIFSGWTKWDLYVNTVIVDNYLFGSIRYLGIYGNKAIQIWDISNNSPVDMGYSGPSLGYSNGIGSNGNLTAICRQNGGIYLFNTTDKTYAGMQKSSAKIKNLNIPGESWGADL